MKKKEKIPAAESMAYVYLLAPSPRFKTLALLFLLLFKKFTRPLKFNLCGKYFFNTLQAFSGYNEEHMLKTEKHVLFKSLL